MAGDRRELSGAVRRWRGGVLGEDFPAQLAGFGAGSLVAGYRLEAPVGAGGMAVVFRARDERLGRLVALKILAPALAADGAFRRRFIAESRAAAGVDDPHIIPVYEAGEAGGVLFIAMRFVQGGDLRGVLEREGPLAPGRAAGFLSPVASALDAAHRAGLVHRDVKPANILVDAREDRPDHVYLSDFGVSKGATASVSLTGTGQFLGTPHYCAPEQIEGRGVDGRADQYALACVAYELLAGAAPFERDQGMAVLLAHLSAAPPSLGARRPGLPGAADAVLARGMAKVPEQRYGSCREFADALRAALGLAPYHPRGPAFAAGHPRSRIVSPRPRFPGPAAVSPAARAGPGTGPAPPPGGGEQRAAPAPRDGHPRLAAGGPGPGPGGQRLRAPGPRRADRAVRRRAVLIAAAMGIAVTGLVVTITTFSGTPHGSARPHASGPPDGSASSPASGPPGQVRWTYTTGDQVDSSPAVAGGTVYIGSHDHKVYALDAATGRLRWSYTTGDLVGSGPAVAGGTVYAGSNDGKVYALDAATGRLRWFYTTGNHVVADPAVAGGTVYVGSDDHKVYALDAATGRLRWTYTTGSAVVACPAVADGTVYAGSWDHKVYALDAATGRLRWSYTITTGGALDSGPAVAGGTVYADSNDGKVYALDAATGRLRWSYTTGSALVGGPAVAGGTVYAGSDDHKVYALDAATGRLRWAYTTGGALDSDPAVAGGTVYADSNDGKVYALDAATGRLRWTYTTGDSGFSVPAVAGGTVYVGSDDHKVYALSAGS